MTSADPPIRANRVYADHVNRIMDGWFDGPLGERLSMEQRVLIRAGIHAALAEGPVVIRPVEIVYQVPDELGRALRRLTRRPGAAPAYVTKALARATASS